MYRSSNLFNAGSLSMKIMGVEIKNMIDVVEALFSTLYRTTKFTISDLNTYTFFKKVGIRFMTVSRKSFAEQ
jgi:hypothetical protein